MCGLCGCLKRQQSGLRGLGQSVRAAGDMLVTHTSIQTLIHSWRFSLFLSHTCIPLPVLPLTLPLTLTLSLTQLPPIVLRRPASRLFHLPRHRHGPRDFLLDLQRAGVVVRAALAVLRQRHRRLLRSAVQRARLASVGIRDLRGGRVPTRRDLQRVSSVEYLPHLLW